MGIQFHIMCQGEKVVEDVCLCAQMAPCWCSCWDTKEISPDALVELDDYADDSCPWCGGTGVETVEGPEYPDADVHNGHARPILEVMGLCMDDFNGEILQADMPAMIRSLMGLANRRRARVAVINMAVNDFVSMGMSRVVETSGMDEETLKASALKVLSHLRLAQQLDSTVVWG